MRKIISLILTLTLLCSVGITSFAADGDTVGGKITLTQFIGTDRNNANSVQLYIKGQLYTVDTKAFYDIADSMIITSNIEPYTITNDGIYICVKADEDNADFVYLSAAGIDRATPATGRELYSLYVPDNATLIDNIISLAGQNSSGAPLKDTYTFEELTKISTKEIEKISIACSKNNRTEFATSSSLIISNIVNLVKDMQFEKDVTAGGGAGGWLYFINFYVEDGTYIQYGTRLYIDKINYVALEHETAVDLMSYYHDLIESIDSSEWAIDYVLESMELGFLEDISELNYKEPITREKFCEIVYNMLSKATDKTWSAPTAIPFNDTYNPKVASLYYVDIIKGKADKQFAPDDFLTREEAATILIRTAQFMGVGMPENAYDGKVYNDEIDISDWAFGSVHYCRKLGVMIGTSETEFAPKETYTSEQAIATMVRLYECK